MPFAFGALKMSEMILQWKYLKVFAIAALAVVNIVIMARTTAQCIRVNFFKVDFALPVHCGVCVYYIYLYLNLQEIYKKDSLME